MGSEAPKLIAPHETSSYDQVFIQQRLHFTDGLKDLKNLGKQLYSAADYYELSYAKDEHQLLVVQDLKDYIAKAFVSTVDHLGSVADKLSKFVDEKVNEASTANLRFCCIQQKSEAFRELVSHSGLSQHSFVINTPKHHKRYILPSYGKNMNNNDVYYKNCITHHEGDDKPKREKSVVCSAAFHATKPKTQPQVYRKWQSKVHSTESLPRPPTFSFMRSTTTRQRAVSPLHFPLKRSSSISRCTSPSSSNGSKPRFPSEPRGRVSVCANLEKNSPKEIELYAKRSKHLLRALLSIHRARNGNE